MLVSCDIPDGFGKFVSTDQSLRLVEPSNWTLKPGAPLNTRCNWPSGNKLMESKFSGDVGVNESNASALVTLPLALVIHTE